MILCSTVSLTRRTSPKCQRRGCYQTLEPRWIGVSSRDGHQCNETTGQEIICSMGKWMSSNPQRRDTSSEQPGRGRHQDPAPRPWCYSSWRNGNTPHSFPWHKCLHSSIEKIHVFGSLQQCFIRHRDGQHRRVIKLGPIVQSARSAALPAFYALRGSDNTGSFSGKGKLACWKIFRDADEVIITELGNLGTTVSQTAETIDAIERFVCQLYLPKTTFTKVKDLRWRLFCKKQAQSERLPSTLAALHEGIQRAHYQVMVWNNNRVPNPDHAAARYLRMRT